MWGIEIISFTQGGTRPLCTLWPENDECKHLQPEHEELIVEESEGVIKDQELEGMPKDLVLKMDEGLSGFGLTY